MASTAEGEDVTDVVALVHAWREAGDRADAEAIVAILAPRLADLAGALGLLYAGDQAVQSLRAALQVANPRASSSMWRRKRRTEVADQDWADAPLATLLALSVHALLDLAHVSPISRVARRVPVVHHAVLRLQVADVIDGDRAAELLGVPLTALEELIVADHGQPPPPGRRRRL